MNITLISANSYHIINNEVKKIVKDNLYLTINMNKNNLDTVFEEISYLSFDNDTKYIVVSNADFFGSLKINDSDTDKLIRYFNNPNPNVILIFTTLNGIDSRKKIVKALKEKCNLITINPWDKKKIREEANRYLQNKNYSCDYETMSYIINNTYDNIDILYNELDKIMLFYKNSTSLKINDVEQIIGKEIDSNNFHFVEAVVGKNLQEALRILNNLKVYKVESIALINLLAREYRLMYYIKRYHQKGYNSYAMEKELGLQNWQVTKLFNNSIKYDEKELLKNIAYLGEIDLKIKKGEYDKDTALYPFLLEACI